jgi:hypothetical protein
MDAVCPQDLASDQSAGFRIRLGSPASLTHHAAHHIPPALAIRGATIPCIGDSGRLKTTIKSQGEIRDLLRPTVMLAHKHGWGEEHLTQMMAAATENDRLSHFENLAEAVCQGITNTAVQAGIACAREVRERLVGVGGEALGSTFDECYASMSNMLDFSFGLVNDLESTSFGESSEKFRFRLFSDLSFEVCPSLVTNDYLAAFQNQLFMSLPLVGFIPSVHFLEYSFGWMQETYDLELPEEIEAGDLNDMLMYLESEETRLADLENAADVETHAPELFARLVGLVGSQEQAREVLSRVETANFELGDCVYSTMWRCLEFSYYQAITSEVTQSEREISGNGGIVAAFKQLPSIEDNTYLSQLLQSIQQIIEREISAGSRAKAVFNYIEESDITIDLKLPFETLAISRRNLLEDAYENHHEFAMGGDVYASSVCVHVCDDTVMAMESWQRCIVIMAAIYTAGNHLREEESSCK